MVIRLPTCILRLFIGGQRSCGIRTHSCDFAETSPLKKTTPTNPVQRAGLQPVNLRGHRSVEQLSKVSENQSILRTPVQARPPSSNKSPHSRQLLEQLQRLRPGPVTVKVKLPKEPARTRDAEGLGHEMQAAETLLTFPRTRALSTFAPGNSLLGMTLESLIRLTFLRQPCYPLSGQSPI